MMRRSFRPPVRVVNDLQRIFSTMADQESPTSSLILSNYTEDEDIQGLKGYRSLTTAFFKESNKLWHLAGPAIFTSICQYSLGAITQTFAGHISELALAAVSIENSVIAGLSFAIMMGMGSAQETLCGQAFEAGQHDMLGVYMQRSWIILNSTALVMAVIYMFSAQILKVVGQDTEIAELAGKFAIWMLPQLFAYAMVFPLAKFLQAQSKVRVMAAIAGGALVFHVVVSWALIMKAGWGLAGAAVALNVSWWIMVVGQMGYVMSGRFTESWRGFSRSAFRNLVAFMRQSWTSSLMLCSNIWYIYILILLDAMLIAGYLKHPKIPVDAISICLNLVGWELNIMFGFNIAISARVSNELRAGHPRAAKFSAIVVVGSTFFIGCLLMIIILVTRNEFPIAFTSSQEVRSAASDLAILLALRMLLDSVQQVLSGVAVGAGWQTFIAYFNLGCYYILGLPLECLLCYTVGWGVKGILVGMIIESILQIFILSIIMYRIQWNEVSQAKIGFQYEGKRFNV